MQAVGLMPDPSQEEVKREVVEFVEFQAINVVLEL
jgi:hypothetical protein